MNRTRAIQLALAVAVAPVLFLLGCSGGAPDGANLFPSTPTFPKESNLLFALTVAGTNNLNAGITMERAGTPSSDLRDVNSITFAVFNHTSEAVTFPDPGYGVSVFRYDVLAEGWDELELPGWVGGPARTILPNTDDWPSAWRSTWTLMAEDLMLLSDTELRIFVAGTGNTTGRRYGAYLDVAIEAAPAISRRALQTAVPAASGVTATQAPSTEMPVGVFNPTQAALQVQRLLRQNDYCAAGCIWGVVPGRTTLDEAQRILSGLGSPLVRTGSDGKREYYESSFGQDNGLEEQLSFSILVGTESGVVQNIAATVGLVNYAGPSTHHEWAAYAPEEILSRYGLPAKVLFSLFYPTEPGSAADAVWYSMAFHFESQPLIIEYRLHPSTPVRLRANTVEVCPVTDRFESVSIWLGEEPRYAPSAGLPLEQATTLTSQEFFDTVVFRRGCLDLIATAFLPRQ
jgi:hypothetical protein